MICITFIVQQLRFTVYDEQLLELKEKEILVTGGCGFIGSEITKQLSSIGANVTIIDNLSSGKEEYIKNFSNVKLIKTDLMNSESMPELVKEKDYVIDLAALPFIPDSYYIPKKFFEINVMTLNRTNITWIVVSLAIIYFFMTQVLMYDLYDLPKSKSNCEETPKGLVCELSDYSFESEEYRSRK